MPEPARPTMTRRAISLAGIFSAPCTPRACSSARNVSTRLPRYSFAPSAAANFSFAGFARWRIDATIAPRRLSTSASPASKCPAPAVRDFSCSVALRWMSSVRMSSSDRVPRASSSASTSSKPRTVTVWRRDAERLAMRSRSSEMAVSLAAWSSAARSASVCVVFVSGICLSSMTMGDWSPSDERVRAPGSAAMGTSDSSRGRKLRPM